MDSSVSYFDLIVANMRDARKLFRLFKSVNEYQKIMEIIAKGSNNNLDFILNIANRIGFLLYWFFDNLVILAKVKFLKLEIKPLNKAGSTFWFLALVAALITNLKALYFNVAKLEILKGEYHSKREEGTKLEIKKLISARTGIFLNIIKTLGDMITSSQASEIFPKLTNKNFNDGWIGLGGLTSAVITSYQLY